MATVNIRRDISDPFYRYKMERLVSKVSALLASAPENIANL